MISIPNGQRKWAQINSTDLLGNLWITKNITLDNDGYLMLSSAALPFASTVGTAALTATPVSFALFFDTTYYSYFIWSPTNNFKIPRECFRFPISQITGSNTPTNANNSVFFDDTHFVGGFGDIFVYEEGGGWSPTNSGNSGQFMAYIPSQSAIIFASGSNNASLLLFQNPPVDSNVLPTTIMNIPKEYYMLNPVYFNQNIYIPTYHKKGEKAALFIWNGTGTAAQYCYEIDDNRILGITIHKNAVFILSSSGKLLRFNGGGFDVVAQLPISYTKKNLAAVLTSTQVTSQALYSMESDGENLFINVSNQLNTQHRLLSQPDGIWCYNENVGLYHRYSWSSSVPKIEETASINTSTDQITVTIDVPTGTEVTFNGTTVSPLAIGKIYYAIRVDSTHIKLATTLANANAGIAIDLTSGSSGSFTIFKRIDWGATFGKTAGGILPVRITGQNPVYSSELIYGCSLHQRQSATENASTATVGTIAEGISTRGYFVTNKYLSTYVTDKHNLLTLKFGKFNNEKDQIIIKYRTTDDELEEINVADWNITWTSSTTFTTSNPKWSEAKDAFDSGKKWEVEILRGAGQGLLAHISNIEVSSGTYTVTIDEAYDQYSSGDLGSAVFRNFIKFKTISYGDPIAKQRFYSENIGDNGKFIQFKVELRGVNVKITDLLVNNQQDIQS